MDERRRFRRAQLEVPVSLRSVDQSTPEAKGVTAQAKDISLAGLYCVLSASCSLKPGDRVLCSVEVPPEQMRVFPFSRISGQGVVVRVGPQADARVGLAVAFAPDITALGSIEY